MAASSQVIKFERTLFEPEHELFRESYRAFLDRHVAPFHEQWEKDKIVDRGVWLEAGKQGFLGMAVPEEYGGGGNPDFRYNAIITEETTAGRFSGLGFTLQNDVIAPYLLRLATEEQKQRWLPGFCSGELITGDRHDRTGHRQRPAGHQGPRGQAGRRQLDAQRRQDVHHQRHSRRPGHRRRLHRPRQGCAGLLAAGRRARHGGLRARPSPRQDRPGRPGHRRAVVHRRASARREPAGRGGVGLRLPDAEPAPGAHQHRGDGRGGHGGRAGADAAVHQGAQGLRQADRQLPEQPVHCSPSCPPRPPSCG